MSINNRERGGTWADTINTEGKKAKDISQLKTGRKNSTNNIPKKDYMIF